MLHIMGGDIVNTMKTTFDFNFDLYQAFKRMDTHKHGHKEKLSIKKAFLCTLLFIVLIYYRLALL